MDRYMKFDVEGFLEDSKKWGKEKLKLERKRDNLFGLSALSQDTPVQTSNISDTTGNSALKILEVQTEIERLETYELLLKRALMMLTDKEMDAIQAFFFMDTKIYANVNELCNKWECEPATVYRVRRRALDKIALEIAP